MQIDVVSTFSAKRATTYDYVAEWAPGVQPLDDELRPFDAAEHEPPV